MSEMIYESLLLWAKMSMSKRNAISIFKLARFCGVTHYGIESCSLFRYEIKTLGVIVVVLSPFLALFLYSTDE